MPSQPSADAVAPTLAAGDTLVDPASLADSGAARPGASTTTVLPRVESKGETLALVFDARRRYAPDRVLGEGGMGEVRLALDNDIGRPVAVKQIRREVGDRGVARFVEEVHTVGRLEHPNIVPIHDVGLDEDGRYFLVMKYVEGETLERVIERLCAGDPDAARRYPFEARVSIFIGLLRALAHAHERGIVHRDVKPANVMVGPLGEVVLMDWGIAKPIGAPDLLAELDAETEPRVVHTADGALVGTPHYMSPEQARGQRDVDARSDLYSACVVFHELMTLRHYLAERPPSVPAILVAVLEDELPSVHRMLGAIDSTPPVTYLHFLKRGMQKDRDARWQSAVEMIAELENALAGRMRVQCPMTLTRRVTAEVGRFVDRHPRLSLHLVVGSVLLAVLGVAGTLTLAIVS